LAADFVTSAIQHLAVIDQMIKDSPEDQELFVELANLLLVHPELNQSFDRAVIISKALQKEIAPNNPIGYRLEASVFLQKKQLKEAEGLYERALALAPDDQTLLEELTMTKLNLQDITGAKKITERWLQQNPNEVRALLAISYLDFYEKNYLSTIPNLMKVINLLSKVPEAPRRLEALHLLGLVYWEQGQTNEATSYLAESCKWGFKVSCQHEAILTKKPSQP
jgi:tetratricopeptide (TPR) repeat protein